MFRLVPTMRRGSSSGMPAAWAHYPLIESARTGAADLLRDDRILRVMVVRNEVPPAFVEWIERWALTGSFRELLAVDHARTLEFFLVRLQDVSASTVDREELLYNASVLAHYAQVSTHPAADLGAPASLSAVFDLFVADPTPWHDAVLMETAGAQCLLLTGFFEDQMRTRHNIRWYAQLGAGFFGRAALQEPEPHKARLLDAIATRFEPWRQRHAQLGRELRDQRYLLPPPKPPSP